MTRKAANQRKSKEKLKLKTSPETNSPFGRIYHVSSLNHPVIKRVLPTLCTFSPPLVMNSSNTNWEKHEIKIRVLHKVYKQVFKQLYSTIVPTLTKTRVNPHKETIKR
jgi:hypothetical protein